MIGMPYELLISLRYLNAKRKQAFISLISIISIGGVAVGVAALIIVLAVMTGFKNDVRDKILGTMAHIIIQQPGSRPIEAAQYQQQIVRQTQDLDQIRSLAPYVSGQLLLSSEENVAGIKLLGIDPQQTTALAHLEKNLLEGHVSSLQGQYENFDVPGGPQRDGILIGRELARILGVFTGDDVTLVDPMGHLLPTGPAPKLKKLRVVGIFGSGFYEYDAGLAYISLTVAQKFFSMGTAISGVEIRLDDVDHTPQIVRALKQRLGGQYQILDWGDMNQSLFSAINLEKLAMFLILALIVLVAAFNIISTLVMMVMEKQADIAILKSMGATSDSIMYIFMLEGSIIGVIGTILGTLLGVVICWVADAKKLIHLEGGMYHLEYLPFTITILDLAFVIISALVICFVSTIYPARRASKLDPVAAFRYE
ncbi:lipoprotein-releasing ABC transporter permease subunit [candidate division KSB3 bacterium]|uniref:Lipoprotein-releasing ABC transporter permease subunit n=1 Tax=candidate division KSB3 bacterium TaxID=2044937 RepID=A0A9D5Q8H3_9BACT|nr:lipoprotein-releasing ABC transporter permease subunit [candidate division KSB3 bacterium]MBD3327478.1 lipoprotein-releasing ABC transporter permease subunit [candidate division KSB3 bacterium]